MDMCHFIPKNTSVCSPPSSSVMKFLSQEYWSGLPFPPPGYLPDPGIEPASLISSAVAGRFFTNCTIWEAPFICISWLIDFYVTLRL